MIILQSLIQQLDVLKRVFEETISQDDSHAKAKEIRKQISELERLISERKKQLGGDLHTS